jgi:hypothetical protein
MWQIDERIKEPPQYSFEIFLPSSVTKLSSGHKDSYMEGRSNSLHRSSFSCTASIVLHESRKHTRVHVKAPQLEDQHTPEELTDTNGDDSDNVFSEFLKESDDVVCSKVSWLEAVGTGATKREARHAASAKLLMLLFPTCSTLVEVIAAAEAAREAYAASRLQSKQHRTSVSGDNYSKHCIHRDFTPIDETSELPGESNSVSREEHLSTSEDPSGSQICETSSKGDPDRREYGSWSESLNVENLSISESKLNSLL